MTGSVRWLLTDHLGSTSITTNRSGEKISELRYDPFGAVRYSSGSTPTNYTYTGQYSHVDDFGLMYYVARWYDPVLGRFVSADTVVPGAGNPMAYDRYAYVYNNPLRFSDPTGHCAQDDDECWRLANQLYEQYGWRIKGAWSIEDVRLFLEAGRTIAKWFDRNGGGDAMGRLRAVFGGIVFAHADFIGRSILNAHHVRGSTVFLLENFTLDTVIHELGHVLDNRLGFNWPIGSGLFGGGPADDMARALGADPTRCGWNRSRCPGYETPNEDEFPAFYASNGPSEDFAVSFRFSVLDETNFQDSHPLRAGFLAELAVSLTETRSQYALYPRPLPVPTPSVLPKPYGTPIP